MQRISGRSLALVLTVAALGAWSATCLARDVDNDNPRSATGDETSWGSDLEGSNQNQNQNQNGSGRQNRDQDSDPQHHAALGVTMDDAEGSVRVTSVLQGSPAARAGLQVGDEIRSVDGDKIRTSQGLAEEIGEKRVGSRVELGIRHNGERRTLQVRLATQDELYGRNFRGGRNAYASNDENNNRQNQNGQGGQNNSGRNRSRSSSYDPESQSGNIQTLTQQVRSLKQQVSQLEREINDLRNQQNANTRLGARNRSDSSSNTRDGNQSGQSGQSGENGQSGQSTDRSNQGTQGTSGSE